MNVYSKLICLERTESAVGTNKAETIGRHLDGHQLSLKLTKNRKNEGYSG